MTGPAWLRLLAVLHYVLAAMTALGVLIGAVCIAMGMQVMQGGVEIANLPAELNPTATGDAELLGMALVATGIVLVALCLVHALVVAWIGWLIANHRRRMLCLAFAVFHLMNFPFGTALSIFTIVVLRKPPVRALF